MDKQFYKVRVMKMLETVTLWQVAVESKNDLAESNIP